MAMSTFNMVRITQLNKETQHTQRKDRPNLAHGQSTWETPPPGGRKIGTNK
jgi:hypothetical protein